MAKGRKRIVVGAITLGFAIAMSTLAVASYFWSFRATLPNTVLGMTWSKNVHQVAMTMNWGCLTVILYRGKPPATSNKANLEVSRTYSQSLPLWTLDPKNPTFLLMKDIMEENNGGSDEIPPIVRRCWCPFGLVFESMVWPFPLVVGLVGFSFLVSGVRARKRVNRGWCGKCGYDLRATPAASPCPECGTIRPGSALDARVSDEARAKHPDLRSRTPSGPAS